MSVSNHKIIFYKLMNFISRLGSLNRDWLSTGSKYIIPSENEIKIL